MKVFKPVLEFKVLFIIMGILILILGIATTLSVLVQRDRIIEGHHAHARDELNLIGVFIQEELLKGDYAVVEQFVQQWSARHEDIIEFKATASDGFVLAHFISKKPAQYPYRSTRELELANGKRFNLEIMHDLKAVKEVIHKTIFRNLVALVIFALVAGAILWLTLRKMALIPMENMIRRIQRLNETLEERVRERTDELIRKNRELEREISERLQAENAARESEEKYRNLYNNAPDMYHTLDKDGIFTECNETECRMLGYKKEEIIGRSIEDFVTEKSKKLIRKQLSDIKENNITALENLEREFVRKDGTVFPVNLNILSEFDEKGELVRINAILRDITLQKIMEDELSKMDKLDSLGILAGGIAHDFNNLLTSIAGNIAIVKMYAEPDSKTCERITQINKAILRAKDLTMQMLTFAKGGAPVKRVVDIRELVEDTICFATRGTGVACDISIADDLLPVEVDVGQLHQVLNNLVINASQAMPEGGTINVRAENIVLNKEEVFPLEEGSYIRISIQDYGKGISRENLENIFDPFFTTKEKGSGLGLATAFSITKRHDGYLTVQSQEGMGTTFNVYLPASTKQGASVKAPEENPLKGSGRILLMDDEVFVRDAVGEMLSSIGYKVEYAGDGAEAIERYMNAAKTGATFDLVIMDLTIQGGMGGKEAVKRLLEIDPQARIIVASGYSNDPIMSDHKAYGFKGALLKPFDIHTMNDTIRRALSD